MQQEFGGVFVGKSEENRPLGRLVQRWKDNNKTDVRD
jgi:hypothetical protein